MSIYLAWSVYKLFLALLGVLIVAGTVVVYRTGSGRGQWKEGGIVFVAGVLLVLAMALNIGDRQQSLSRSNFNATPPEPVVVVVQPAPKEPMMTREDVKLSFEQAVKKTQ